MLGSKNFNLWSYLALTHTASSYSTKLLCSRDQKLALLSHGAPQPQQLPLMLDAWCPFLENYYTESCCRLVLKVNIKGYPFLKDWTFGRQSFKIYIVIEWKDMGLNPIGDVCPKKYYFALCLPN